MEDVLDWCQGVFDDRWLRFLFKILMLLFGAGAVAYVMNIFGVFGRDLSNAGLLTRMFDIVFFALFALVAAAIAVRNGWAVPLWLATALLQVLLFTLFPETFRGATTRFTDPTTLIQTHALFFFAFATLLVVRRLR